MTILNELDAQTLANYALRSGERSRARRADAEELKKSGWNRMNDTHVPSEKDAERLEKGQKRAREKLDAKFDNSKEGKAAKDRVIGKAASSASHAYDGSPTFTSKNQFRTDISGGHHLDRTGRGETTTLYAGGSSDVNRAARKANDLKDRVSSLSKAAHANPNNPNWHRDDDKAALAREVKDQAKDKSFFGGTRTAGRALSDTASKIKNAAKRGVKSASSGLSSLKKRVFGEEYYEDLDYRYTVIPLLDSLLEGNSSDIEHAFNEAVSHRIENAILTARLRIAEGVKVYHSTSMSDSPSRYDKGEGGEEGKRHRNEAAKMAREARAKARAAGGSGSLGSRHYSMGDTVNLSPANKYGHAERSVRVTRTGKNVSY